MISAVVQKAAGFTGRRLRRLITIAAAGAVAVGVVAAPASATPPPPIPSVVRVDGMVTSSLYVQRHVIAGLPSASPDATRAAVDILAGAACGRYFPEAAEPCAGVVAAVAEWGLPVPLAQAKANGSCLRMRFTRGTTLDLRFVFFYEDHNPAYCLRDVYGSIGEKWMEKGGRSGFLGYALTDELATPHKPGRFNHFKGGSIYWSPSTGAHEIRGAIRDKWASLGWENSFLGFPVTDELGTPDKPGRFNHFQGGSIYWSPSTGAHEIRGAIRDKWASLGWENSRLGFPTSDEYAIAGGGRRSDFQNGCRIDWFPSHGATAFCTQVPPF